VLGRVELALGASSLVEETLGVSVNVCDILDTRDCLCDGFECRNGFNYPYARGG
jgi:hypothetical protein